MPDIIPRPSEFGPWELREGVRARASELEALLIERRERHPDNSKVQALAVEAVQELDKARDAVSHSGYHRWYKTGAHLTVGQIHLDTAHNLLLRLSLAEEVIPMMPGILAFVQEHLPPSDPRRIKVEVIDQRVRQADSITPSDLESVLDAVGCARGASIRKALQIRNFAAIVAWVTVILVLGAGLVALIGAVRDDTLPLCFTPPLGVGRTGYQVVCPVERIGFIPSDSDINHYLNLATTPADYVVVELVGLVAASISAATSLRKMRGTTTPYNVPVVLAALKLPMGALTAVLGLLLMRGGFVPGLAALDSSAQIIAWAIVFGYSQQLFTRLVDSQAEALVHASSAPRVDASPPPSSSGIVGRPTT
ncbi:hypothetical protein [Streptomyces sp. NPDC012616]|uniref:hypothetical protein n=1 Tax=Streptomyces sp. NPDC012616 TaxID=3364840 RepID=UPI0036E35C65